MLKDLVLRNRSYRSFDPTVVPSREELLSLIDCARLTPSGMNKQPLKYKLFHTADECAALLPLTRWAAVLKDIKLPPEGHAPTAYIVICADTAVLPGAERSKDIGIVAQTILLAATEMGYGGCMIGSFDAEGVRKAAALPEHLSPVLIVALGKPDEEIVLTDCTGDDTAYYRENGIHYVPKRALEDILID